MCEIGDDRDIRGRPIGFSAHAAIAQARLAPTYSESRPFRYLRYAKIFIQEICTHSITQF